MGDLLIFKKIPEAIGKFTAISKDKNHSQGYKYRGIEDALAAAKGVFAEVGITPVMQFKIAERGEHTTKSGGKETEVVLECATRFYAEDSSYIECVTYGQSYDNSDKGFGKAMSYAYKYAIYLTFVIPTKDLDDTDDHAPEGADNKTPAKTWSKKPEENKPAPAPETPKVREPLSPEISAIRAKIDEIPLDKEVKNNVAKKYKKPSVPLTLEDYQAIENELAKMLIDGAVNEKV